MERGRKKREKQREGRGEEREKQSEYDGNIVGYSLEMYHEHCRFRASFEYIYLCTWESSTGGCLFSSKCEYNRV
jgi:hypothetical protein